VEKKKRSVRSSQENSNDEGRIQENHINHDNKINNDDEIKEELEGIYSFLTICKFSNRSKI